MMAWLRGFGSFFRNHWHHALVVVFVVLVFFSGAFVNAYDKARETLKFLPARR